MRYEVIYCGMGWWVRRSVTLRIVRGPFVSRQLARADCDELNGD